MKIDIDIDYSNKETYLTTEYRTLIRIGEALDSVGNKVTYRSGKNVDIIILSGPVVDSEDMEVLIRYANGGCEQDSSIDGVIYSQLQAYKETSYKNSLFFVSPFQPSCKIVEQPESKYILTAGGLYPNRAMHIPVLAMSLIDCDIPLKIVYQPSKSCTWPYRDPDGLYRKTYDFYYQQALDNGCNIIESDFIPPPEFEKLLSEASAFIYCDPHGMNTLVAQEALMYGVPLIATLDCIDYTTMFYACRQDPDWYMAPHIAELLNNIFKNYDKVRQHTVKTASDLRAQFSYQSVGNELQQFFEKVLNDK